jgi:hypothetical protein
MPVNRLPDASVTEESFLEMGGKKTLIQTSQGIDMNKVLAALIAGLFAAGAFAQAAAPAAAPAAPAAKAAPAADAKADAKPAAKADAPKKEKKAKKGKESQGSEGFRLRRQVIFPDCFKMPALAGIFRFRASPRMPF